jgi:pyruvate formate lyase activating enzyme
VLPLKGIQKTTLIDYPGKIASTIFLGGCNFRCPFCHNVSLVNDPDHLPTIQEEELLKYLEGRKKYIDGICITGGEPLLYPELLPFLKKLKDLGYSVKVDTNGTNSSLLQRSLAEHLVDHVAMDIKSSRERYAEAAGGPVDLTEIDKSISLLKEGLVAYEFRTTVVPRLFGQADVPGIGEWLKGAGSYYLQLFEKSAPMLDAAFQEEVVYSKQQLEVFAEELRKYVKKVEIR